jgi:hypothetical protein
MGARTWTAYASVELAGALLTRPRDRDRALKILKGASSEAIGLGMGRLADSIDALLQANGFEAAHNSDANIVMRASTESIPLNGRGCANMTDGIVGGTAEPRTPHCRAGFRSDGDFWTIEYEERVVRLRQLKGLALIVHLLSRPNQAVHVLELAQNGEVLENRGEPTDLGPALDVEAKRSYRERIRELGEDLEEARACGDTERASKIEDERRFLTRELARAVGLLGRDRKSGSDLERARIRVTNAIKLAVTRIAKHHPSLGSHLERTIKTGTVCSYVPDPSNHPDWAL